MSRPETKEIKQKKCVQGGDRNKKANTKVAKLTKADILLKAIFPTCITNLVMVKKRVGTWRMCIKYSDLNNACPKDCYPLPEIDQKVDSLHGFQWKCLLDSYKGYLQILMSKEVEERTAFYTEHGAFCNEKMSFGLKNIGATYHRLVDSLFLIQIGRNIKVYVDDMVVKSPDEQRLLADVEETL